jgi:dethiobiotin synthetase
VLIYGALSEVVHHDGRAFIGPLSEQMAQDSRLSGAEEPGDYMYGNRVRHGSGLTCGPMTRWFITGTDTGVGKTVVTACLAEAAQGDVRAVKPVESGIPAGQRFGEDARLLGEAAGHPPLCAEGFEAPVSPHRAAKREGRDVDLTQLSRWIQNIHADTVLVEGAGGWRVPWVQELCGATDGRVLVVAANRLGVINHTRLTVEAILNDGFDLAAVILNGCGQPADASSATNLEDLSELLSVPVVPLGLVEPENAASRARCGRDLWRALS